MTGRPGWNVGFLDSRLHTTSWQHRGLPHFPSFFRVCPSPRENPTHTCGYPRPHIKAPPTPSQQRAILQPSFEPSTVHTSWGILGKMLAQALEVGLRPFGQEIPRSGFSKVWSRTGVPNPRATDQHWSAAYQELGCTAGGEQRVSERSFICCSPSLTLPPEPSPHPPSLALPPMKPVPVAKKAGDCWSRKGKKSEHICLTPLSRLAEIYIDIEEEQSKMIYYSRNFYLFSPYYPFPLFPTRSSISLLQKTFSGQKISICSCEGRRWGWGEVNGFENSKREWGRDLF